MDYIIQLHVDKSCIYLKESTSHIPYSSSFLEELCSVSRNQTVFFFSSTTDRKQVDDVSFISDEVNRSVCKYFVECVRNFQPDP